MELRGLISGVTLHAVDRQTIGADTSGSWPLKQVPVHDQGMERLPDRLTPAAEHHRQALRFQGAEFMGRELIRAPRQDPHGEISEPAIARRHGQQDNEQRRLDHAGTGSLQSARRAVLGA